MTQKLVSFGCSYTAGQFLSDVKHTDFIPSKFAWPEICAKLLKIECDNNAVGGSGNLEILYNILKYDKFNDNDIVVVMWTHFNRDVIFSENNEDVEWKKGAPGARVSYHEGSSRRIKELTHHWLKTHSDYDINIRQWMYINHANEFFKSRNLNFYHLFFPNFNFSDLETKKPSFLKLNNVIPHKLNAIDLAYDNSHPGDLSHITFGKLISEIIPSGQVINIC